MPWESVLKESPEFLQAIGMISVENANLEMNLSALVGAILDVPNELANAIYLTPKSAFARLEILENLAAEAFHPARRSDSSDEVQAEASANDAKRLKNLVERCKGVVGRRHSIIHDAWGIIRRKDATEVARHGLPLATGGKPKPVSLDTLQRLVTDYRAAIDETETLMLEFRSRRFAAQHLLPDKTGK